MPPQIKQAKLREEFKRTSFALGSLFRDRIADWWLAKISQAKLETLEAIIKEVEGMKHLELSRGEDRSEDQCENDAFDQVLSTLQSELTLLKNER